MATRSHGAGTLSFAKLGCRPFCQSLSNSLNRVLFCAQTYAKCMQCGGLKHLVAPRWAACKSEILSPTSCDLCFSMVLPVVPRPRWLSRILGYSLTSRSFEMTLSLFPGSLAAQNMSSTVMRVALAPLCNRAARSSFLVRASAEKAI